MIRLREAAPARSAIVPVLTRIWAVCAVVVAAAYWQWSSLDYLAGVIPATAGFAAAAVAAVAGVVWPEHRAARAVTVAAVTVTEAGYASTLLVVGAGITIPRSSELLGVVAHGGAWIAHAVVFVLLELIYAARSVPARPRPEDRGR